MRILITGVSGFAGAALLPRLLDAHHKVRALARDPLRVRRALAQIDGPTLSDFELVVGDALAPASLHRAMRDVEVAYYLIHSMEPQLADPGSESSLSRIGDRRASTSLSSAFAVRERLVAEAFAAAAHAAGVRRIVYLGGLQPAGRAASPHLASRRAVERILLGAAEDSLALRASIVIGARSRSFRFLVRLIERLPVLMLPAWRRFRTQPIDERDVIEMLAAAATVPSAAPRSLDIGGPEALTYGEIVKRIAELMLLDRPTVGIDVNVTPLAARLASLVAGESPELIIPLMESLNNDLLPADHRAAEMLGVQLHSFDSAVEHALYEWEKVEPLAAR
ncbi:MAG TPA: NAD(P)H-binding protein [Steroidobacteraceae bacterium]|nr:NAD(P)H-binding protein [Steroidobacteraceae bacterium]